MTTIKAASMRSQIYVGTHCDNSVDLGTYNSYYGMEDGDELELYKLAYGVFPSKIRIVSKNGFGSGKTIQLMARIADNAPFPITPKLDVFENDGGVIDSDDFQFMPLDLQEDVEWQSEVYSDRNLEVTVLLKLEGGDMWDEIDLQYRMHYSSVRVIGKS